jgi:hypothetical protein
MNFSAGLLFGLLACAAVTGCAGAEGPEDAPGVDGASSPGATPASARTLAELAVAQNKVSFVMLEDGRAAPSLGVLERGPAGAKAWTKDLASQGLTTLEMFLALAPEGAEPPQALVDAHTDEARALGRSDASIRRVTVDVNAPVEKSLTTCWADIAPPPNPNAGWSSRNMNSDTFSSAAGGTWDFLGGTGRGTVFWNAMTTCNESASVTMQSEFAFSGDGANWAFTPLTSVGPGGFLAFLYGATSTPFFYAAFGQSTDAFDVIGRIYFPFIH